MTSCILFFNDVIHCHFLFASDDPWFCSFRFGDHPGSVLDQTFVERNTHEAEEIDASIWALRLFQQFWTKYYPDAGCNDGYCARRT